MPLPLAEIDIPAVLGVLTGFGLVVVVPIVALFLNHQRKMAELIHGQREEQGLSDQRIARLEAEVHTLKQQLTDNIIAFDDRRDLGPPPAPR